MGLRSITRITVLFLVTMLLRLRQGLIVAGYFDDMAQSLPSCSLIMIGLMLPAWLFSPS